MTTFIGFPQGDYEFSAAEVGLALSGLVVRESSGVPRVGMMGAGPSVAAVSASWKVQVSPFVYVHQVAGAIQLSGVSVAEQVDITPAAGSLTSGQKRIDRIAWNPVSAELVVIEGAPAATPAAPPLGGLASVGTVLVEATDGIVLADRVKTDYQRADRVPGVISVVGSGCIMNPSTTIERDALGMVDAYLDVTVPTGLPTNRMLLTLPEGFRPKKLVEASAVQLSGGTAGTVFTQLLTSGALLVWNAALGNRQVCLSVRYQAAL